jgi:hypothetical protein
MLRDLRAAPYAQPICSATCGSTQVRIHNVDTYGITTGIPAQSMRAGVRVQRSQ